MTAPDDIELPALPPGDRISVYGDVRHSDEQMRAYARLAVTAERERMREVERDAARTDRAKAAAVVTRLAHPTTLSEESIEAIIDYFGTRNIIARESGEKREGA